MDGAPRRSLSSLVVVVDAAAAAAAFLWSFFSALFFPFCQLFLLPLEARRELREMLKFHSHFLSPV
jgi:hypothetical protein